MDKPAVETGQIKNFLANFMIPLISLGIAAALFFIIIYPGINQKAILEQELSARQNLADSLKLKYQKLSTLLDFKSSIEENRELVSAVLAEEPLVPQLLTQIDVIATDAGLTVTKMSYAIGDTADTAPGVDSKFVTVKLTVNGTYPQTITFLESLENSGRIVTVDNMRFGVNEDDGSVSTTFVLLSPYVEVNTQAVTDDPIDFDVTDPKFQEVMERLKKMKIYNISVDETISIENLEEDIDSDLEEETPEFPEPSAEVPPLPEVPAP